MSKCESNANDAQWAYLSMAKPSPLLHLSPGGQAVKERAKLAKGRTPRDTTPFACELQHGGFLLVHHRPVSDLVA